MKRLKLLILKRSEWIIPALITIFAITSPAFAHELKILEPYDRLHAGILQGMFYRGNDSAFWDTISVGQNDVHAYDSAQLVGAVIAFTSGVCQDEMAYVQVFMDSNSIIVGDTAIGGSKAFIGYGPKLSAEPDSGDTYKVFWGVTEEKLRTQIFSGYTNPSGKLWPNLYYTGINVVKDSTFYSKPIPWSVGKDGIDWNLGFTCQIDTIEGHPNFQYFTGACSLDVAVWVEISDNAINWTQGQGETYIYSNIKDTNLHTALVQLIPGTAWYRFAYKGNVGNSGHMGRVWLRSRIWIMGR